MANRVKVELSKREKTLLNQIVNRRSIEKHLELRIKIMLMSAAGILYRTMKKELNCSEPTISNWRQRWSNNYEKLKQFVDGFKDFIKSNKERRY